jgi:hypothetical protein
MDENPYQSPEAVDDSAAPRGQRESFWTLRNVAYVILFAVTCTGTVTVARRLSNLTLSITLLAAIAVLLPLVAFALWSRSKAPPRLPH